MKNLITISLIMCFCYNLSAQKQRIKYEEKNRQFTLYVPKSADDKPLSLIINLHGSGMSSTEQMFYTEMNKTADKYGFAVLYPQGIHEDWNVGFEMDYDNGPDDVGYIKKVLEEVRNQIHIDSSKIFVTGISRGGFFAHRLISEMPNVFSGICVVGAPIPNKVIERNKNNDKIAILLVHGTDDQVVNYNGKQGSYSSIDKTIEFYQKKKQDHEMELIKTFKHQDDTTEVKIYSYDDDQKVKLIKIENGGHTWPGSHPFNAGFSLGNTSKFSINDYMWDFFNSIK